MKKEFYTTEEIAQLLGITKESVLNHLKSERAAELPPVLKLGGKFLFPIEQYEIWKRQIGKSQ